MRESKADLVAKIARLESVIAERDNELDFARSEHFRDRESVNELSESVDELQQRLRDQETKTYNLLHEQQESHVQVLKTLHSVAGGEFDLRDIYLILSQLAIHNPIEFMGAIRKSWPAATTAKSLDVEEFGSGLGTAFSDTLERQVMDIWGREGKIQAIKLFRNQTGAGLKEAKDAVEAIGQK